MIVREKTPRYIAYTWQEFLEAINGLTNFLPKETTFLGRKCIKSSNTNSYSIEESNGRIHYMDEDSVLLIDHAGDLCIICSFIFWQCYEMVVFK